MGLIRRNWIWILVIVLAVAGFAALQMTRKQEAEYFTSKVEKGDIRQVIDVAGTISPVAKCLLIPDVRRFCPGRNVFVEFKGR